MGAGSYLSILIGEDNKEIQRRLVGASNICILLFSVITMILGLVFMNPLLHTMGATGDILQYAKEYYTISLIGMPFSIVAFLFMLPLWGVSILMPQTVLGFMLPNTSFSIENIHYFQIFITVAPLLCIVLTAMTFYPAIKKPKPAMLVGMGRQVFLYIPLMILLPKIMGIGGIYIGSFGIDAFLTIIIVLMLRKDFTELREMEHKK